MRTYILSYIKSLKYIIGLLRFKEDKIKNLHFIDESYKGLDGLDTILRIFYTKKKDAQSIIIFPGASPYAEEHPGMIMLGNALRNAGYNVFLPRIPNLKNLILVKENVDWFSHCYQELLKHESIKNNVIVVGLSYGGANLLKASMQSGMQKTPPKSILSYGTYFSIETSLDFFLSGNIIYKNKKYLIKPHEWGVIVIFYNFFKTLNTKYDQKKIMRGNFSSSHHHQSRCFINVFGYEKYLPVGNGGHPGRFLHQPGPVCVQGLSRRFNSARTHSYYGKAFQE